MKTIILYLVAACLIAPALFAGGTPEKKHKKKNQPQATQAVVHEIKRAPGTAADTTGLTVAAQPALEMAATAQPAAAAQPMPDVATTASTPTPDAASSDAKTAPHGVAPKAKCSDTGNLAYAFGLTAFICFLAGFFLILPLLFALGFAILAIVLGSARKSPCRKKTKAKKGINLGIVTLVLLAITAFLIYLWSRTVSFAITIA